MNTSQSIIKHDCSFDAETLRHHFGQDVLKGLSKPQKTIPSKYIYDEQGSELFCKIMDLPEYYLTDCETEVLSSNREAIDNLIGSDNFNLIELGAGDGAKTRILLEYLVDSGREFQYCPIDISESAVVDLAERFNKDLSDLEINGLVTDYFEGLNWLSDQGETNNLILFLGSNIGNFSPPEAVNFLKHLRRSINTGDHLLIGFDLKKEVEVMLKAYDDDQGVTEEFNTNLLARINRELGGEFELENFSYKVKWDAVSNAIKSYQVSTCEQHVNISTLNRSFAFEKSEPIHTESSHKFTLDQISDLANEAGFKVVEHFLDDRGYFVDSLWKSS
ncbi:MAG: L-histidine N(alpha)-methyltransferase [Nitrospirota bacterium]|nr:MAG: L-histidine N(alpha)-methyltransferase [Nitrospirota bacterium]